MRFASVVFPLLGLAATLSMPSPVHAAKTRQADAPGRVYDVRQFGAAGSGGGFDTAAIQRALDTAGAAGGGTVRVPPGTYRIQPIHLRTHVTLQIDEGAVLRASDDPRDFERGGEPGEGMASLINAKRLTDVAITGGGIIDGSGARWWRDARPVFGGHTDYNRPRLVNFAGCQRVTVEGVTLRNSPIFHLTLNNCENVTVRNVVISAPADSPNTDGIDPAGCRGVLITGCRIDVGDDDVAIKSFHPGVPCMNITVSNCTILHGHGVSIGSETLGGVSDVTVQHCTFEGTRYGFRIKSGRGRGGLVENIRASDIQMRDVDPAIDIMCYYPNPPMGDVPRPMAPDTPVYRHIHIENLTASCPREAGLIIGLPESPITDVTLTNVHISSGSSLVVRDAHVTQN